MPVLVSMERELEQRIAALERITGQEPTANPLSLQSRVVQLQGRVNEACSLFPDFERVLSYESALSHGGMWDALDTGAKVDVLVSRAGDVRALEPHLRVIEDGDKAINAESWENASLVQPEVQQIAAVHEEQLEVERGFDARLQSLLASYESTCTALNEQLLAWDLLLREAEKSREVE